VWADVEGTLDRDWVNAIGGDPEKYSVILADYGEQYSNISDNVLKADNCGLLVVDSLAALVPAAEMEAAAEDDFYALQARMIGRMVRKLKQRLIRERKRGHPCCIIFTNQLRMKIGQKFGDPETMSGGHGMKHEFSLLLRCVKKALNETDKTKYVDKKRKKNQAIRHSFAIRKEKILTLSNVGEYIRVVENIPSLDLKKGMIDDMGTVMTYAKEYDIVRKGSGAKPWKYFDYNARTLDDIKLMWKKKDLECLHTKMEIVKRAKERLAGE
jgi:recombination protein RecA